LFENYWQGKGNMWLNTDEFNEVVSVAENAGAKDVPGRLILLHGHEYIAKTISFYKSNKYAKAFGTATLIYTKQGKAVGFYDGYDFDAKPWGQRSIKYESETRGVNIGSYFSNAKNFKIYYNMGVLFSQTYIDK
jgi:hypothetical protein